MLPMRWYGHLGEDLSHLYSKCSKLYKKPSLRRPLRLMPRLCVLTVQMERPEQSFKNTHIHMHYIKLPESSVGPKDGLAGGSSGGVNFIQLVMKHTYSN